MDIFAAKNKQDLSVRFLETSTSSWTTELLGLASARIGNEQTTIVLDQNVLDFLFGCLINVLLVESNQSLADGLTNGIDLRDSTTTTNSYTNVNGVESERKYELNIKK